MDYMNRHFLKQSLWTGLMATALLSLNACDEIKRVKDINLGTGHSAHELCSRVFISGQDPELIKEDILVQKVYPMQWVWNIDINEQSKQVSVGAPFLNAMFNATAVYREPFGCTLTHGQPDALFEIPQLDSATNIERDASLEWPLGEQLSSTDNQAYDMARINAAIDDMFRERFSERFKQINTYAVLVVHNGKLISERYDAEHTKDNRLLGWSISKSVTALLMGILAGRGDVSLDQEIKTSNGSEKVIRLRHVLNMASGLDFEEGYEEESDISNMLYVERDASAYALSRPLIQEPGNYFYYSTGDTQILSNIIQNAVGGSAGDAYQFYQRELFHKLGINSAVVEHDASGTFIGGARMFMRPRDWAKIGLLVANGGEWFGEQIVPADWVDFMLTPSHADMTYGGQVWLYDPDTFGDTFPNDAYVLWGVLEQMIVVVPSENLIVIRMGATGSELSEDIVKDIIFNPILEMMDALPKTDS